MVTALKKEGFGASTAEHTSFANSELLQRSPQAHHRLIRIINVYPRIEGRALSQVTNQELHEIVGSGVHGIWLMGIMQRSEASRQHALNWKWQYTGALPDVTEADVIGSAFAHEADYPDEHLTPGNNKWEQLAEFVGRIKHVARAAIGEEVVVLTDLVPNHRAVDHRLVYERSDLFVHGTQEQISRDPASYFRVTDVNGREHIIARARSGWGQDDIPWADAAQLKTFHPDAIAYQQGVIARLARIFDGVRIDMAMLVSPHAVLNLWRLHLTRGEVQLLEDQAAHIDHQALPAILQVGRQEAARDGREFHSIAETYAGYGQDGNLLESVESIYEKGWYDHLLRVFREGESMVGFTQAVRNNLRAFAVAALFAANHDETPLGRQLRYRKDGKDQWTMVGSEDGVAASIAFLNILGMLPSRYFLIDDMQEVGYEGDHIPMQVRRLPKVDPNPHVKLAHDVFYTLKASTLFQTGIYDIPPIKMPNDNEWSGEHPDIFQLRATSQTGKEAVIACMSGRDYETTCRISVPSNAKDIRVIDGKTGEVLPDAIIDHSHGNGFLVILPPFGVQFINYTID